MSIKICAPSTEGKQRNVEVCASSNVIKDWKDITINTEQNRIKKLQQRIAKAQQEGRYNKVKSLQYILTRSHCAKFCAVDKVTKNKGRKTPGVDGVKWSTSEDKLTAIKETKKWGYTPMPLKQVYVLKPNGTYRPISIPTMKDRTMQAIYKMALEPIAELVGDPHSYGFRVGRNTQSAIIRVKKVLSNLVSHNWLLKADIADCFGNISHKWLMDNIQMDKAVLSKFLKSGYIESGTFFPTKQGTPQGGLISPVLCNMTLDGLEKELKDKFRTVNFIRYADDFIVTGKSKKFLEQEVIPVIESFLNKRGLHLSPEKTKITCVRDGFNFLGWNVRKVKKQVIIIPSRKNLENFLFKIQNVSNAHFDDYTKIELLKPKIRGWFNYHKDVVSQESLRMAEKKIRSCLGQLVSNKHLNVFLYSLFSAHSHMKKENVTG